MKLTVHENFAQVFADYRADTVRGGEKQQGNVLVMNYKWQDDMITNKERWWIKSHFIKIMPSLAGLFYNPKPNYPEPDRSKLAFRHQCDWRRIGSPFSGLGIISPTIFSSGNTTSHLYLLTTLWTKVRIASRAYSFPGHILGPAPKGTNVNGGKAFPSSCLDGSSFSGSGKYFGFLFVVLTVQYIYKCHRK